MDLKYVLMIAGVVIAGVGGFFVGKSMCKEKKHHHMMMPPHMMMGKGGKPGHPYMHHMGLSPEDE
jgi:hypothetical protein